MESEVKGNLISSYNSILNGYVSIRSLNLQQKFTNEAEAKNLDYYRAYYILQSFLNFILLYGELINLLPLIANTILLVVLRFETGRAGEGPSSLASGRTFPPLPERSSSLLPV